MSPHPALGKSKGAIRDEVLVALDGAAGQRAALIGDVKCDFQDINAEGRAWEAALDGAGLTALDQQGGWGKVPTRTRMPWVPKKDRGAPRHLDVVLAPGPAVAVLDPRMVAIGTDPETPGFGACPKLKEHKVDCRACAGTCMRRCACLEHQHSDHKLVVWGAVGKL